MWEIRYRGEYPEFSGQGVWFVEQRDIDCRYLAFSWEDAEWLCDTLNSPT